ncbi:hypothetical protein D3C71_1865990 [compost metagenome]
MPYDPCSGEQTLYQTAHSNRNPAVSQAFLTTHQVNNLRVDMLKIIVLSYLRETRQMSALTSESFGLLTYLRTFQLLVPDQCGYDRQSESLQ